MHVALWKPEIMLHNLTVLTEKYNCDSKMLTNYFARNKISPKLKLIIQALEIRLLMDCETENMSLHQSSFSCIN